jgi:anti-sigma B factor antagonist
MSKETNLRDRDGAAPPLVLERGGSEGEPILVAVGEIDVATSPLLRAELATLIAREPNSITLDLEHVSFVDSSGLGVLVGALKRFREAGDRRDFTILHPQDAVRKVFDITGLDDLFDLRG